MAYMDCRIPLADQRVKKLITTTKIKSPALYPCNVSSQKPRDASPWTLLLFLSRYRLKNLKMTAILDIGMKQKDVYICAHTFL